MELVREFEMEWNRRAAPGRITDQRAFGSAA